MVNMNLENLKEIGLSDGQISVYNAVLELGVSTLNKIQEKTGIERRNIYDILNKLIEKGLISYTVEKGKRTYQCTHPNKIVEEIKRKEEALKELEEKIPQIKELFNISKPEISAEVFRGRDAMKAIFEDMLNYKENWFIGGNGGVQKYMPFFWENWNRRRIKNKTFWHDLIDKDTLMDVFKNLSEAKENLKQLQLYEYKILPEELVSPHVIFIYGDKIANVLWSESPFAFVIQNKEIADSYRKYFSFLWRITK